jgi:hypothetical protein
VIPESVRDSLLYKLGLAKPKQWVSITPPADLQNLILTFVPPTPDSPSGGGDAKILTLRLRLYGTKVDMEFKIDDRVTAKALSDRLTTHFRLQESVAVDFSSYPCPTGVSIGPAVVMYRNGQPLPEFLRQGDLLVRAFRPTLRELSFQSGDIVTFIVTPEYRMNVSHEDGKADFKKRWPWGEPPGSNL